MEVTVTEISEDTPTAPVPATLSGLAAKAIVCGYWQQAEESRRRASHMGSYTMTKTILQDSGHILACVSHVPLVSYTASRTRLWLKPSRMLGAKVRISSRRRPKLQGASVDLSPLRDGFQNHTGFTQQIKAAWIQPALERSSGWVPSC